MELMRISIDTSKHVFAIHGVDREEDYPVVRRGEERFKLATPNLVKRNKNDRNDAEAIGEASMKLAAVSFGTEGDTRPLAPLVMT